MSATNILKLLKRDYYLYKIPIAYVLISLFFMTGFILFVATEEYCTMGVNIDLTSVIRLFSIIPAWLLMAAGAFHEFRRSGTRSAYLLLPVSTTEKWFVRWFEVTIIFLGIVLITSFLAYTIFTKLIYLKWPECTYLPWSIFLPSLSGRINYFGHVLLLHSLLFLFGIIFNRYGTFKSIFSVILTSGVSFLVIRLLKLDLQNVVESYYILYVLSIVVLIFSFFQLKKKEA